MTVRERAAVLLVLLGAAALTVAATARFGWTAGLATIGLLMLGVGVLLGTDRDEPLLEPGADL